MSRAFVDEESGSEKSDALADIPLPIPPGAKNYMTSAGAARMATELRRLREEERPAAAARPEGPDAVRRLAEIDRRISYLERMSSVLEVVDPPAAPGRVVFGTSVRVRMEDGEERGYRIVGADESDPERGLISWASPVAKALIGRKAGEFATARLPKGESRMKILDISSVFLRKFKKIIV